MSTGSQNHTPKHYFLFAADLSILPRNLNDSTNKANLVTFISVYGNNQQMKL